jgi:hypothetical protein
METFLLNIANNKLFMGSLILLTNIGSKYIVLDLPNNIEKLFSKYTILRYSVLFSIFFMSTRDIKISILLLLLFFIFTKFFINEKSTFCLVDNPSENKNKITNEEYIKAKNIIENYQMQKV